VLDSTPGVFNFTPSVLDSTPGVFNFTPGVLDSTQVPLGNVGMVIYFAFPCVLCAASIFLFSWSSILCGLTVFLVVSLLYGLRSEPNQIKQSN
jgi:hypothetical protein